MTFDRVFCISLARRSDRLQAFMERVPSDWPYRDVEVLEAVDGKACKPPNWWKQGGGAWGCYKSHIRAIEDALNSGNESILIFEDDATFVDGFSDKATQFLESLPAGWGQAYFGGQHLRRPEFVSPGVVRVANVNRTHAYALRGRKNLEAVYKWLHNTQGWKPRFHIDHHYGQMHQQRLIDCYAPEVWLCGQAADKHSDVCWKPVAERWWSMTKPPIKDEREDCRDGDASQGKPFVLVLGLHRSGSSCTAMVLHKLGVNMGDKLGGYEGRNGGGGEAVGLARICERAARFPRTSIANPEKSAAAVAGWVAARRKKCRGVCGGKYPTLCALAGSVRDAVGDDLLVIHCDRPLEDSIDSLKRRSRKSRGFLRVSDAACESVQRWLWGKKQEFLSAMPADRVLHLSYDMLRGAPEEAVASIVSFLGITPSDEQVSAAVSHIKKPEETAA